MQDCLSSGSCLSGDCKRTARAWRLIGLCQPCYCPYAHYWCDAIVCLQHFEQKKFKYGMHMQEQVHLSPHELLELRFVHCLVRPPSRQTQGQRLAGCRLMRGGGLHGLLGRLSKPTWVKRLTRRGRSTLMPWTGLPCCPTERRRLRTCVTC